MRSSLLASAATTTLSQQPPQEQGQSQAQGQHLEKEEEHRCDDSDVVGASYRGVSGGGGGSLGPLGGSGSGSGGIGIGIGSGGGSGGLSAVQSAGVRALLHQSTLLTTVPVKGQSLNQHHNTTMPTPCL